MRKSKYTIRPGDIIDEKYQIDASIGEGGMGTVYEGTHTVLHRKVAIKILLPEYASEKKVVQRFHQEAQIAGSLGHDNICEVNDLGTLSNGAPYLVMPLLKGNSLAEILDKDGRLPLHRVADITSQTLLALAAAHKEGIVHRDLKPDNIYICTLGDREDFVKMLDFGISKVLNQETILQLTRTGSVMGTPYYMSPEQARDAKDVDRRTDIYAVGAILYEALTGNRPFQGHSYSEIILKILTEPFPSPRSVAPEIPLSIERVIIKAMERNPQDRFATAEAMSSALERALHDHQAIPQTGESGLSVTRPTEFDAHAPFMQSAMPSASSSVAPKTSGAQKAWVIALVILATLLVAAAGVIAITRQDNNTKSNPHTVPLIKQSVPKINEKTSKPALSALPEPRPLTLSPEQVRKEARTSPVPAVSIPPKKKSQSTVKDNEKNKTIPQEPANVQKHFDNETKKQIESKALAPKKLAPGDDITAEKPEKPKRSPNQLIYDYD